MKFKIKKIIDVCIYVCIKNYPFDYLKKNLKQHINAKPIRKQSRVFKREKQFENGGHKVCMPREGYDHIQEDVFCIHRILNNLMMQVVGVNNLIAQ